MKNEKAIARLHTELLPMRHLWDGIEKDLVRLGITSLADLRERDPDKLFRVYCANMGQDYDVCVLDTFTALVSFARTGKPRAWWRFTRNRGFPAKGRLQGKPDHAAQ